MNLKKSMLLTLAIVATPTFAHGSAVKSVDMHTVGSQIQSQYPGVNWITVDQISESLPQKPVTIGLDIDDTMLFSSPVFYYGQQKYSPDSYDYLKNQEFWNEASTGLDRFSVPKKSALKLVNMHLKHGDKVYFVTGRTAPEGKEKLTSLIKDLFAPEFRDQIQPVVFANGLEKAAQLKQAGISIFYGDADQDITSAKEAGAKGIRFLRGAQSTYTPLPSAGKYGEPVLVNSNY